MKSKKAGNPAIDHYKDASRPAFLYAWNSAPGEFDGYEDYLRHVTINSLIDCKT